MHQPFVVLPLLLSALFVHAEHPLIYTSPARFADEAAEAVFAGDAGGEAANPVGSDRRADRRVVDRSTLIRTIVGFPQDFLDGLVAEERNGYISYPISVRIDPASGYALFENAAGRVFYAIAPADGSWTPPAAAARVEVRWRVLQDGTPGSRLRTSDSGLRTPAPDTLRLSSIACFTNGVAIGAAWPASDAPTNGVLDLYFSTHLDRDWRLLKTMAIPVGATNLTTFLAITDIPSYTNLPPAHVHDADCHIVTNISPNIFSGGAVVTNIHWSCAGQRIPPYEGDSGFFRLGTRDDTDGDGVSDGAEVTQGSDPNDINDGVVAPDAENFVDLPFHIYGDWAAWRMNIEGLTGDSRTFRFHTDAPGDSETRTLRLLRGNAYRVTMDWFGSDPHRNPYWYCWEAQFGNPLTPNTQSFKDYNPSRLSGDRWLWGEGWIADNADGLLTSHVHSYDGHGGNIAEGKEAVLYIPKADLAIYRLDATTPVNALYEGSEGSIVRILNPNRGELPGTGRAAGCALRIDSTFSDAGLPGATATLLLHPVPTDLHPPLVRLYRETAGGGLSLVLSNTDASPVATIPWPVREDTLWLEFDRAGVIDVVLQIHRSGELLYEDAVRATGIPADPAPGGVLFVNRRAPEGYTYADFAADAANSIEAALRVAEPNDNIVMATDNYSECAVNLPSGVVLAGLGGRFSADADASPVGFDFSFAPEMQSSGFASTLICNCIENSIVAGLSMRRTDRCTRSGGAASLADSEDIVFENISFHQNTASEFGGALCLSLSSNIVLSCCIASNNVVDFDDDGKVVYDRGMGGAIAAIESALLITNCLFDSNAAQVSHDGHAPTEKSAGRGGDIYLLRSSLALKQSSLRNSRAGVAIPASVNATSETMTGDGGSILVHGTRFDTVLDIDESSFESCKSYGNGGAIYIVKDSGFETRKFFAKELGWNDDVYWNSLLLGLEARPDCLSGGCLGTIRKTTFSLCKGGWQGGALSANGRTVEMLVTNCVFRKCFGGLVHLRDGKGGALALGGGLQSPSDPENCITMIDCLIDRCSASGNGGGLYVTIRGLLKLGLTDVLDCAALNLGKIATDNFARIEGMGGGIHISAGGCVDILPVGEVFFSGNRAAENGGGISVKSGRLSILGSLIVEGNSFTNTPVSGNGNGGGVYVSTSYNDDGWPSGAGYRAAELYREDGTVVMLPGMLTLCDNSAVRWGGGLYVGIPPTTPTEELHRKAKCCVILQGATIDGNSAAAQASTSTAHPSQICLERLVIDEQHPMSPDCGRVMLHNSFVTGGGGNEIGAYSFDAHSAVTNNTSFTCLLYDILVEP